MTNTEIILKIQAIVEDYFKLKIGTTNRKSRELYIVNARQITHFFCAKYTTNCKMVTIAKIVGNVHRTTAHHSKKTVLNQIEVDKHFRLILWEINNRISKELHD